MKKIFLQVLTIIIAISANAQSKKTKDKNSIKEMCGCFEITFNFTETFNYSKDAAYLPSKTKVSKGLEWAELVEDKNNKLSIQHILQVGNPNKPMIVKHWRQDWLYQNTAFYMYNGDNQWVFEQKDKKNVRKQWTQKVYQVDDSPRYEGSATWVHVDGKSYWENISDAPLPRREYSKRSDYNITERGNRQEITNDGWIHDQDNSKIIRSIDKNDILIAKEKGLNYYKRVDDSRCKAAADWWTQNYSKWKTVRDKWNEIYSRKTDLKLHSLVDSKPLYRYLFDDAIINEESINKTIESFINLNE